ncbi:hypothetical protein Salat_1440300 [Sesamum alatum]|uniref:PB1 domain-containing protein n=1 Tax=Sesamum alatum TaxID=300844 RepID=A0AAE1YAM0_9LAMI|nr:hypothetical protein Salat_1440300 [Sesamum alatum]
MDPPPSFLHHHPATISTSNHPDSANSSPRSRPDAWDHDHHLPPVPGAKLRLMCSYGGHIIPRPHDKSLCYVGGDTRIVVVDRHSSLAELHSRLSHILLNGRHFTLKYQLPNEDLDSLISLSTDEDLENMIEEYDRTNAASPLKSSRLRLFLFPSKPETAASMGSLLDDAKSETWFVDALNGAGLLPRGLSESAAIDTLLELDHGMANSDSCADLEAQNESNKQAVAKSSAQEVVLDSPHVAETSSSFGSSSSTPSMANLPPIKVRVEDYQMVGLDEQFSHVSIASQPLACHNATVRTSGGMNSSAAGGGGGGENLSRVICDDEKSEKSDHGTVAPTGLRKPPLPLQTVQRKLVDIHNLPSPDSKHAGGYNLPSPDSVASDCSIASAGSLSKHTFYQDTNQILVNRENRVPTPVIDQKMINTQEPTSQISADSLSIPPLNQNQQFIHPTPSPHYIHHPPAVPMSSYYPVYLHPQTQQSVQHQADQQYPMYLLPPLNQTQPCYDASVVASSRPLTPPPNNMVPYKETVSNLYPTKPEMAGNMYQTAGAGPGPVLVQVPTHQFQQQFVGLSQIPPPSQSNAASAVVPNYGYEYTHHMQDQVYYAQHLAASAAPPPPPQYQTMTPAAAVMLSQAQTQLASDSGAQQS